jgi:hypothetical protein
MRRLTAAIALVLATVLALGVLSTRAQQPAGPSPRPNERKELRARIVALRAELEVLRLRHEAARATLIEALKSDEQLEFALATGTLEPLGVARMLEQIVTGHTRGADGIEKVLEVATAFADDEDKAKLAKLTKASDRDVKKDVDAVRKGLEGRLAAFTKLVAELNEKAFDLADAERHYNESR